MSVRRAGRGRRSGGCGLAVRLAPGRPGASRLATAARRRPPAVARGRATVATTTISVVVPARDEAAPDRPLLDALRGDPTVARGDRRRRRVHATAPRQSPRPAGRHGRHRCARCPRAGWASRGRCEQGLRRRHRRVGRLPRRRRRAGARAARRRSSRGRGRRPRPADRRRALRVPDAGRCAGSTPPCSRRSSTASALPGAVHAPRPARVLANGQCTAVPPPGAARRRRASTASAGHLTDDVALARAPRRPAAGAPALLDGTERARRCGCTTTPADAWRDWGRSLPLPDVTAAGPQLLDLATLLVAQALPLPRLLLAPRRRPRRRPAGPARSARWPAPRRAYERARTWPTGCRRWPMPPPSVLASALGCRPPGADLAGPDLPALIAGGPAGRSPPPARTAAR